ncbi:signal peptidase I [Candidatus Oleimmundimicrobium sp.]|uniref:signal peptidase I n=1 Tax=Candidatus Oleimmundimicrobium sp. TaxID=3060597 RepID=UPI00272316D8|nr:signal peptidase I [Candidatus Oleimmundimicrobium sp.]MDO8885864.1 signal peptidase I [Candidatus Oleimmundimicrobium sp.]
MVFIKETVFIIVAALIFSFIIRFFVVEALTIQQHSMDSTLHDGDRVLVSKFVYRLSDIENGDIIILKSPMNKTDFVKRVVATEGQTIEIKEGVLVINGKPVEEPYIKNHDLSGLESIEIPQDYVFVAGDNRPNSYDSRIFGPILEDDVVGKAFFIYWPVDRIGLVN